MVAFLVVPVIAVVAFLAITIMVRPGPDFIDCFMLVSIC